MVEANGTLEPMLDFGKSNGADGPSSQCFLMARLDGIPRRHPPPSQLPPFWPPPS
jgi:hypothetical protein